MTRDNRHRGVCRAQPESTRRLHRVTATRVHGVLSGDFPGDSLVFV
jgi:hypothetical protein